MENNKNLDSVPEFTWVNDFIGESDRGCVLIAHALLEERIGDLIEVYLLTSIDKIKTHLERLRTGRNNPMGSFIACVEYAESLQIITQKLANILKEINKMRKAFAHYQLPRTNKIELSQVQSIFELFDDNAKKLAMDFIKSENFAWPEGYSEARRYFVGIVSALFVILDTMIQIQSSSNKS
jgi:uncharacterized protein YutE (UPF0331/DUF86 family)